MFCINSSVSLICMSHYSMFQMVWCVRHILCHQVYYFLCSKVISRVMISSLIFPMSISFGFSLAYVKIITHYPLFSTYYILCRQTFPWQHPRSLYLLWNILYRVTFPLYSLVLTPYCCYTYIPSESTQFPLLVVERYIIMYLSFLLLFLNFMSTFLSFCITLSSQKQKKFLYWPSLVPYVILLSESSWFVTLLLHSCPSWSQCFYILLHF